MARQLIENRLVEDAQLCATAVPTADGHGEMVCMTLKCRSFTRTFQSSVERLEAQDQSLKVTLCLPLRALALEKRRIQVQAIKKNEGDTHNVFVANPQARKT